MSQVGDILLAETRCGDNQAIASSPNGERWNQFFQYAQAAYFQLFDPAAAVQTFSDLLHRPRNASMSVRGLTRAAVAIAREARYEPNRKQRRALKSALMQLLAESKALVRWAKRNEKQLALTASAAPAIPSPGPATTTPAVDVVPRTLTIPSSATGASQAPPLAKSSADKSASSSRLESNTMAQRDASAPPSSAKSSGTGESVFKSLLDRCARVTQRLGAARQSRDAALGYGREAAKYYEPAVQQLNQLVQFYAASNKQVEQLQGQLDECDGLIKELSTELSHAGDRYYSAEAYLVAVDRAREWEQAFHEKESAATNFRREVGERDQQLALRLIEIVDSVAPLTMADGHGKPSGKPDHASIREETFVNKLLKVLSDTWRIQQLEVAPDMQFDGQTMELSTTVEPTGDAQRGTVAEVLQRGYFYAGTRELLRPAKVIVYGRSR